jgi:hypothetical protein
MELDKTETRYISDASLQELPEFPYSEWTERKQKYTEKEKWFTGDALDEQPELQQAGKKSDLYPMRINPLISTVLKHAYILFGEVEDDGRPLVWPKLIPKKNDEINKTLAEEAEEALNGLWWENSSRALMLNNAIVSQIYGGCIFKAIYAPWETWRTVPIKIERINPKYFIGYPDGGNPFRLARAWFLRKISGAEAYNWGLKDADPKYMYWYAEKWTPDEYQMWVDGKPVQFQASNGKSYELGGENRWGAVPGVYIPHIRIVNFYGENAYDHLTGYVKEMNRVMGDYGDAVNDDSHPAIAIRDVQGNVQMRKINQWLEVVDLGSAPNITGTERGPDMFEVRTPRASISMKNLFEEVYQQYRRDAFIPAVADGEDEGSQRSSLTLNTRFWPLTSHAGMERYSWSSGLDFFQTLLLRMMSELKESPVNKLHLGMRMKQKWAPMLPRDREADVNEWVTRQPTHLGSIEHILELSGDVEDTEDERQRIMDDIKEIATIEAEAEAQAIQKYPPPIQNTFGQGGAS